MGPIKEKKKEVCQMFVDFDKKAQFAMSNNDNPILTSFFHKKK